MTPGTPDFSWDRARAFLATAEEGSLTAAARRLGTTQPTVGRQVAALETSLGVVLFERIKGRLEPTPVGLELAQHVRTMAESAARIGLVAAGESEDLEGTVRVSVSDLLAAHLLPPVLSRLRAAHPRLRVDLIATSETSDLQRHEADLAVRHFVSESPELLVRKVGDHTARFYATPGYLSAQGLGERIGPDELPRATFLGYPDVDAMVANLQAGGLAVTADQFAVTSGATLVQWALCCAGLGLSAVMRAVGDADPRVVPVDLGLAPLPVPVYLTAHRGLRTSRRLRVVWDALAEHLSSTPTA